MTEITWTEMGAAEIVMWKEDMSARAGHQIHLTLALPLIKSTLVSVKLAK